MPSPISALGTAKIIAFDVRELARSRAFYVDRLGLPVVEEVRGEFVMVEAGSCRLCLDQGEGAHAAGSEPARLLFEVPQIDATVKFLDSAGVRYDRKRGKTAEYLEVGDPDGYVLVFSEKL